MGGIDRLKSWARGLKRDAVAVYFVARHPRTPWPVRLLALAIAAYALSPIDLIPDFIPILGYLDEAILLPAGIALVLRLAPPEVLDECRARAHELLRKPRSIVAATVIVLLWLAALTVAGWWLWTKTHGAD